MESRKKISFAPKPTCLQAPARRRSFKSIFRLTLCLDFYERYRFWRNGRGLKGETKVKWRRVPGPRRKLKFSRLWAFSLAITFPLTGCDGKREKGKKREQLRSAFKWTQTAGYAIRHAMGRETTEQIVNILQSIPLSVICRARSRLQPVFRAQ